MEKIEKLFRNWHRPRFWTGTVLPYLRSRYLLSELYSRIVHGTPTAVMNEDWDNLYILDACRYDTFSEVNSLDGTLEYRISQGSVTGEFLTNNFPGSYSDTVYVTGNPHVSNLVSGRFHDMKEVWKTDWDGDLKTVTPETMVQATEAAHEEYPNKRIIAHFVQPHTPYIGNDARARYKQVDGLRPAKEVAQTKSNEVTFDWTSELHLYQAGEVSRSEIVADYKQNLRLVLEIVSELIKSIPGKTVLTADHGEMFGEVALPYPVRRTGHFGGLRTTELVKIPWFVPKFKERKSITDGTIQDESETEQPELREKLRDLGYNT